MNLKRTLALTCALALLASPVAYAVEPSSDIRISATSATYTMDSKTSASIKAENVKTAISEEEALKIAIATFAVPESYGKPMVNFWQNEQNGMATWNFNWNPETHPNLAAKFYLSIGVNANDGSIISYSWSDQFGNEPKEAKFDRESARPMAQEWLEKLVPEARRASLKLMETGRETSDQVYYSWIRLVNGIPFYNDMVGINIDPVTGDLQHFNLNWEAKLEFPAKNETISLEKAQEAWNKKIGAELLYQDFYHQIKGAQARLIYRPMQEGLMVDAATGQVIDWNGNDWSGDYKPVPIPAPSKPVEKPEKPLTQEEALDLARRALGGETMNQPASISSHERFGGKFESQEKIVVWNFSWNNEEKRSYTNVGVDATHGIIIELYSGQDWQPDESYKDKKAIDEADARQRAIDAFIKIRPDLAGQVQLLDNPVTDKFLPPDYVQREYNFNFVRVVDGIRYPNNYVNLVIDRYSGDLRNMYSNWTYGQLPAATDLISRDQALAVFQEEAPLELVYVSIYPNQPIIKEPAQPSIKLVYRSNMTYGGSAMIDAKNGHLLDYDGRDLTELRKGITDIADHEAKKEIETAVNQGIFETTDGKFNPSGNVSKGELAKALVTAFNRGMMYDYMMKEAQSSSLPPAPSYADIAMDNDYAPYINAAIQMGIFKPAQPDSKFEPATTVTKEEVALAIVRAMGFRFIDGFAATIDSGYTDQAIITEANRNAVGLLVGLKVLTKGGEFKPQTAVTRAELAKIIVTAAKVQLPSPYPYYR